MGRKHESQVGLTCGWEQAVCGRPARKRGYCNPHYTWHHRNNPQSDVKPCSVAGCLNPHRARSFCAKHYDQLYQRDRSLVVERDAVYSAEYYDGLWEFVKKELNIVR